MQQIQSKCSKECTPGQMKKTTRSQHICCYECVNCPENHYSNQTGNYRHHSRYSETPGPFLLGRFFFLHESFFFFIKKKAFHASARLNFSEISYDLGICSIISANVQPICNRDIKVTSLPREVVTPSTGLPLSHLSKHCGFCQFLSM